MVRKTNVADSASPARRDTRALTKSYADRSNPTSP